MSGKQTSRLYLTQRALDDLAGVVEYSAEQWGQRVAERYLADIETALARLPDRADLLERIEGLPGCLRYYAVNRHAIVCDMRPGSIVVLTVIHASMDLPRRLAELRPTLAAEVEALHEAAKRGR